MFAHRSPSAPIEGSDTPSAVPAHQKPHSPPQPTKRPLSVDGVARRQQATPQTRPSVTAEPLATIPPSPKKDFSPPPTPPSKSTFLGKLQMPLIVIAGIMMGVMVQSAAAGQLLIVGYGALALLLRVESRTTFILALLALITTVTASLSHPDSLMGKNFATYTFLLLVIGVISASWESIQQRKLLAKKRGPQRLQTRRK
jgi:hypothetical protein